MPRCFDPKFWMGETHRAIGPDQSARTVAFYLMSNLHDHALGVYEISVETIAEEAYLPVEEVRRCLDVLERLEYAVYRNGWVWVRNMARYRLGEVLSPMDNRTKWIRKEFRKIAVQSPFGRDFVQAYGKVYGIVDSMEGEIRRIVEILGIDEFFRKEGSTGVDEYRVSTNGDRCKDSSQVEVEGCPETGQEVSTIVDESGKELVDCKDPRHLGSEAPWGVSPLGGKPLHLVPPLLSPPSPGPLVLPPHTPPSYSPRPFPLSPTPPLTSIDRSDLGSSPDSEVATPYQDRLRGRKESDIPERAAIPGSGNSSAMADRVRAWRDRIEAGAVPDEELPSPAKARIEAMKAANARDGVYGVLKRMEAIVQVVRRVPWVSVATNAEEIGPLLQTFPVEDVLGAWSEYVRSRRDPSKIRVRWFVDGFNHWNAAHAVRKVKAEEAINGPQAFQGVRRIEDLPDSGGMLGSN